MTQTIRNPLTSALLTLLLLLPAVGALLSPAPADAAKYALVEVTEEKQCCVIPSPFLYIQGTAVATVGSDNPNPSVMFPQSAIRYQATYTYAGVYTPYAHVTKDVRIGQATLQKSNSQAPAAMVAFGGKNNTSTTICGGQCQPRYGTMQITPGGNKFGGTFRVLRTGNRHGLFVGSPGYSAFTFADGQTPRVTGPMVLGEYGRILESGTFENTQLGNTAMFSAQLSGAHVTTGVAYVYQSAGYGLSKYTQTGYDNRTPSGLNGTLSLVAPEITSAFTSIGGTVVSTVPVFGLMKNVKLTFLPEPGQLALLGTGLLALGGLYRQRKR